MGARTVTCTVLLPTTRPLPKPTTTTTVLTARDRLPPLSTARPATARPPVATVATVPDTVLATVARSATAPPPPLATESPLDTAWPTRVPPPVPVNRLVLTTTTSGPSRLTVRTPTPDGASPTTPSPLSLMMMSNTHARSELTTTSGLRTTTATPSRTLWLATLLLPLRLNSPSSRRPPTFPPTTTDTAKDGEHAPLEIMCISSHLTEL